MNEGTRNTETRSRNPEARIGRLCQAVNPVLQSKPHGRVLSVIVILMSSVSWGYSFAGGTGEPNDPYQIATAEQLISIGSDPNLLSRHYVLVNDIDLDPNLLGGRVFSKAVVAPGPMIPETGFAGTFNGKGHKVSGLTIDTEGADSNCLGLFGFVVPKGRIRDLVVEDVDIRGGKKSYGLGGLAGANMGAISGCRATGRVSGEAGISFLGGLVGANSPHGTISRCSATVAVSGTSSVGGLVGRNNPTCTIVGCYAAGSVSGGNMSQSLGGLVGANDGLLIQCGAQVSVSAGEASQYVGGLVGLGHSWAVLGPCDITECYATGRVFAGEWSTSIGGLVGYNKNYRIERCFWDTQTSGMTISDGGEGLTTAQMKDLQTYLDAGWDFVGERTHGTTDAWVMPDQPGYPQLAVLSEGFQLQVLSGIGTAVDPYRIASAEDLGAINRDITAFYRLTSDIDLSGITWGGAVVPSFYGSIDGAGFKIMHLRIQGTDNLGLFGDVDRTGQVMNLGIEDANVVAAKGALCVGILAGRNVGTIRDCHAAGGVSVGDDCEDVGGLVGHNDQLGAIHRCSTAGYVSGGDWSSRLGGLVGRNGFFLGGPITQCHTSTDVSGGELSWALGGLVGSTNSGILSQCYAMGNVSAGEESRYIGGLVGLDEFRNTLVQCYATGKVSAGKWSYAIGGLMGSHDNETVVNGCFWDTQTSGSGLTASADGMGLATAQMQDIRTYLHAGWDFVGETANGTEDIWTICEGKDYPRLKWENAKCNE